MVDNSNTKSVLTHLQFICKNTAGECVEESKCFVDDDRPARDAGHVKDLIPPPTGYTPNANVESLSRTFESYFSNNERRMRVKCDGERASRILREQLQQACTYEGAL